MTVTTLSSFDILNMCKLKISYKLFVNWKSNHVLLILPINNDHSVIIHINVCRSRAWCETVVTNIGIFFNKVNHFTIKSL